jgi:hypothetical protein
MGALHDYESFYETNISINCQAKNRKVSARPELYILAQFLSNSISGPRTIDWQTFQKNFSFQRGSDTKNGTPTHAVD